MLIIDLIAVAPRSARAGLARRDDRVSPPHGVGDQRGRAACASARRSRTCRRSALRVARLPSLAGAVRAASSRARRRAKAAYENRSDTRSARSWWLPRSATTTRATSGWRDELVGRAAEAGAHAVKFQTIVPERLRRPDQTGALAQLRRFELAGRSSRELARAARASAGVMFMSTPFDLESVAMLEPLVDAVQGRLRRQRLRAAARARRRDRQAGDVSTGMTDLAGARGAPWTRVRQALARARRRARLVLLHCVSRLSDAGRRRPTCAPSLRSRDARRARSGYSDHTLGIDAAVARGRARRADHREALHARQAPLRLPRPPALRRSRRDAALVERMRAAEPLLGRRRSSAMQPSEAATAVAVAPLDRRRARPARRATPLTRERPDVAAAGRRPARRARRRRCRPPLRRAVGAGDAARPPT